jgi:hypothetical protein
VTRSDNTGTQLAARIAIASLAAARLTQLIQSDLILARPRAWFFERFPHPGLTIPRRTSQPGRRWDHTLGAFVLDHTEHTRTRPSHKSYVAIGNAATPPEIMMWVSHKGSWLGQLVSCPKCLSVWAAAVVLLAERVPGVRALVRVLAVAGLGYAWHQRDHTLIGD